MLIYCIGTNPHFHAVFCSALAFSSIFRLAARIISSLLRCKLACLSFLSWLQAFPLGCSSVAVVVAWPTLEARLYRVIRSGWTGLAGCLVALRAGPPVGVAVLEGGSWKLGGGYGQISERFTPVGIHAAGFARLVGNAPAPAICHPTPSPSRPVRSRRFFAGSKLLFACPTAETFGPADRYGLDWVSCLQRK